MMPPIEDEYPQERRYVLSSKVAMLEERSKSTTAQMDRIEKMLEDHAEREELLLDKTHTMLEEMKDTVNSIKLTIDSRITAVVEPVAEQVRKYQQVIGWVTVIGGAVFTFVLGFHDHIMTFIKFLFTK